MNLKNLFTIAAVLSLLFGLAFLLMPATALGWYGITLMPAAGILMTRLFAASLLGVAVLAWLARSLGASEARSAIVLGIIVMDTLGFIVSLLAQLGGVANQLGWSTVAIYLLLALGFAYFKFMKPDD